MARGRPRTFDEDAALNAAVQVFWHKGLAATSLDDLAAAMQMNRPSIYNAFGNKDTIYRKALERFCGQLDAGMAETLGADSSLQAGLMAFFGRAIAVYSGTRPAMGCLMICTAPSAALSHPEVGADLRGLIARLDLGFTRRLQRAQQEGELPPHAQPALTAKLLQATLHTLALRARAGASKRELKALARYAVTSLTE